MTSHSQVTSVHTRNMPHHKDMANILSPMADSSVMHFKKFKEQVHSQRKNTGRELTRFLETIWLFTESDIKTILAPSVLFALTNGIALSLLLPESAGIPSPSEILARIPVITVYVWINLMVLCIQNQKSPDAVEEDRINKPTRPLPSGKVSSDEAGTLLVAFIIIAVLGSYCLGAPVESILVIVLGYIYNDLEGAEHPFFKNVLNSLGIPCFPIGALQVAINPAPHTAAALAGSGPSVPLLLWRWILVLVAAIFFTIHIQDIKDQEGDACRNRKTVPLVYGDSAGRWLVVVPLLAWSVALPILWGFTSPTAASLLGHAPLLLLALVVSARTFLYKSVAADKKTFKIYCLWLIAMYCLPLSRALLGGEGLMLVTA